MPILRIDVETVEAIAARVRAEREGTVFELANRLRTMNTELDAAWDGPAQKEFEGTYGDWIKQLEAFSNTLYNINQYLVSVAQNFRELDEIARQAAAGASSRSV
jgi:WXG100 family type VII secretion target